MQLEMSELQTNISELHQLVFEERQKVISLQSQNDDLRLRETEDRRRIHHLLALTSPDPFAAQELAPTDDLRTVQALTLQVQSLRAQLSEHKSLAMERVAALLEERRLREIQERRARLAISDQVAKAQSKHGQLQKTLEEATRQMLDERRQRQADARAAEEARAADQKALKAKEAELQGFKTGARDEIAAFKKACEDKLKRYADAMRKQLRIKEHERRQAETMHEAVRRAYEARIAELEAEVAKLVEALAKSERRRVLDREGFAADVTLLRQSIVTVGRRFLGGNLEVVAAMGGMLADAARVGGEEIRKLEAAAAVAEGGLGSGYFKDVYTLRDALDQMERRAHAREADMNQERGGSGRRGIPTVVG